MNSKARHVGIIWLNHHYLFERLSKGRSHTELDQPWNSRDSLIDSFSDRSAGERVSRRQSHGPEGSGGTIRSDCRDDVGCVEAGVLPYRLQSEASERKLSRRYVCRQVKAPGSRHTVLHHRGNSGSVRASHCCSHHFHLCGGLLCLDEPGNSVRPVQARRCIASDMLQAHLTCCTSSTSICSAMQKVNVTFS